MQRKLRSLSPRREPSKGGHRSARVGSHAEPSRSRLGATPFVLVGLLVLLAGVVLALLLGLFGTQRTGTPGRAGAVKGALEGTATTRGEESRGEELTTPAEVPRPVPEEPEPSNSARPDTGTLRGSVSVPAGSDFPAEWFLEIGPSTSLTGREFAEARLLRFAAGERRFSVDDLPLAGYDVTASADGMNGTTVPVLLDSTHASPFVTLVLRPAGFADGFVLDERGHAVEGARITLKALPDGSAFEARTDEAGAYRFDLLPDGAYRFTVGQPDAPVVPASDIRFRGPSLRLPDVVVPVLSGIRVRVLDSEERPAPGVRVRGNGRDGGYFDAVTDADGIAWGRFLPAGSYKLYALGEEGRGKATLELGPAQVTRVEIPLAR